MKANVKFLISTIAIISLICQTTVNAYGTLAPDSFALNVLGHGSLYIEYKKLIIHVDPNSQQANYALLPNADVIYITHGHTDHYDLTAINLIKKDTTVMVYTQAVKNLGTYAGSTTVMKNDDSLVIKGIPTKAVAAYNLTTSYHPKGTGNGYILTFGEKRVYIAGDTENIPEMKVLGKIDIAFLPMNLPYTMTPAMAAEAAKIIKPDILYIYHFGTSDTTLLRTLLADQKMVIRMGKSAFMESDKRNTGTQNSPEIKSEYQPRIYPNPVKDYLTINNKGQIFSSSIFDLAGNMIMKHQFVTVGEQKIDLRLCQIGIYVLKVQSNELVTSMLILKE